ncbi:MAG: peptidylprolyl isomerase [Planctomycetota bacterium]
MNHAAIADGLAVSLHYRLTLEDGTVAEESHGGEPVVYVQGSETLVPGLERQLEGRVEGEECEIVVEPEEGYGNADPKAERQLPRSMFPDDFALEPGAAFQASAPSGGVLNLWVKAVQGDEVLVTGNHPLAGKTLRYAVQVLEVREASPAEAEPPST